MIINSIDTLNKKLLEIKKTFKNKTYKFNLNGKKITVKIKINNNERKILLLWEAWTKKLNLYDREYTNNKFYIFENNIKQIFNTNSLSKIKDESKLNHDKSFNTIVKQSEKTINKENIIINLIKKIMDKFKGGISTDLSDVEYIINKFKDLDKELYRSNIDSFINNNSDNLKVTNLSDLFSFNEDKWAILKDDIVKKTQDIWTILWRQIEDILYVTDSNNIFDQTNLYVYDYAYSENFNTEEIGLELIKQKIYLFEDILKHLKESWVYMWEISKSKLIDLKKYFKSIENIDWFNTLKLHDFFEIYVVLKIISKEINSNSELHLSIKDSFRFCMIKENWELDKLLVRKIWNIWLDFKEIDFIYYNFTGELDIYDAKFYSSDISDSVYNNFSKQLTKYKNSFNSIIISSIDDLKNNKDKILRWKSWYLKKYVEKISSNDIENEIIFREKIYKIINWFNINNLKIWLWDIKYIFKNTKLKIVDSNDKKIIIEDVFDNFNKLN